MVTGIMDGLDAIRRNDEEKASREKGPKINWLTLSAGEKVKLIFLQELDSSSERYSEKNGRGIIATEHSSPLQGKFFLRTVCTKDEDHEFMCWPCEEHARRYQHDRDNNTPDDKKYQGSMRRKENLYINVLVIRQDGTEEVALLQRTRSKNSYVDDIIDLAMEDGFISNREFTLTRKGGGREDTSYSLMPKKDDAGINVEDYELFDVFKAVRVLDYEEQAGALGLNGNSRSNSGGGSVADNSSDSDSDADPEESDDWI